jgi:hypothetical protein
MARSVAVPFVTLALSIVGKVFSSPRVIHTVFWLGVAVSVGMLLFKAVTWIVDRPKPNQGSAVAICGSLAGVMFACIAWAVIGIPDPSLSMKIRITGSTDAVAGSALT